MSRELKVGDSLYVEPRSFARIYFDVIEYFKISRTLLLIIQASISVLAPLILFLSYQDYATQAGIKLETGCEGPAVPFGMLSGLLFAIQLRISLSKNS